MADLKLMILDPGHFHAALLQKQMYPDVSPLVSVYSPLGPELLDYLDRVSQFNNRSQAPTSWELDVHAGPHSLEQMLQQRPGNCVILSGRNRGLGWKRRVLRHLTGRRSWKPGLLQRIERGRQGRLSGSHLSRCFCLCR